MKVALNKALEIGFDKKPLVVKSQDISLNNQSKIYRYTNRRNQLGTEELEYSTAGKLFHGRGGTQILILVDIIEMISMN